MKAACFLCGREVPEADGQTTSYCSACLEGISVERLVAEGATGPPGQAGRKLGPYKLVRKIGEGGASEVWLAEDTKLGRPVALKLLASVGRGARERLQREAKLAASLDHPNIVKVYDAGEADGRLYIALQYVEGGFSLDGTTLDPRQALRAAAEIARAVAYAHERGVLHRDIKPGNILLAPDGRFLLTDFGVARSLEPDAGGPALSVTGTVLGTPSFMSPEQARGDVRRADERTDVYSLGATLYALLTRTAPFAETSTFGVLEKVVAEEPPPPRTLNPSIPRDVERVILKAMEKEPGRRYASMREFAEDLERAIAGEPVTARGPDPVYRLRKRLARRPVATAALSALLIAGVVFLTALITITREHRQEEARRRLAELLIEIPRAEDPTSKAREALRAAESIDTPTRETLDIRARLIAMLGDRAAVHRLEQDAPGLSKRTRERMVAATRIRSGDLPWPYPNLGRVKLSGVPELPEAPESAEPWDGESWFWIGVARYAKGEFEAALRALLRSRAVGVEAGVPISRCRLALGIEALLREQRPAWDGLSTGPEAAVARAMLLLDRVDREEFDVVEAFEEPVSAAADGWPKAMVLWIKARALRKIGGIDPENPVAYREAAEASRNHAALHSIIVEEWADFLSDYRRDASSLREEIPDRTDGRADPKNPWFRIGRARALREQAAGRGGGVRVALLERAVEEATGALSIAPLSEAYLERARSRRRIGDALWPAQDPRQAYHAAIRDLDDVLSRRPRSADALAERGAARFGLAEYQTYSSWTPGEAIHQAQDDLVSALEINPRHLQAWLDLGRTWRLLAYYRLESRAPMVEEACREAIGAFDEALALAPDEPVALEGRGRVHLYHGRFLQRRGAPSGEAYDRAVGDLSASLKERPGHVQTQVLLGEALVRRGRARNDAGDFEHAVEVLGKVIEAAPRHHWAYWWRGMASYELGQWRACIDDLERFQRINRLQADEAEPYIRAARRRLREY